MRKIYKENGKTSYTDMFVLFEHKEQINTFQVSVFYISPENENGEIEMKCVNLAFSEIEHLLNLNLFFWFICLFDCWNAYKMFIKKLQK